MAQAAPSKAYEENNNEQKEAKQSQNKTKLIAFIRHAQAMNNIDSYYWDVANTWLTEQGEKSVKSLRKMKLEKTDFYDNIELVVSSPLLRTLQTSYHIFEGRNIPMMVSKHITECYSATCDEGTPKTNFLKKYPQFTQYKGWDALEENWWPNDYNDNERHRMKLFTQFLYQRPEQCVAVVSHSSFLSGYLGRGFANAEINWYQCTMTKDGGFSYKHIKTIK
eukprot:98985_1